MKFVLIAQDTQFTGAPGFINGGTVTLWHMTHTLEGMGYEAVLHELDMPLPEADVYIVQSEWYSKHKEELQEKRKNGSKLVVWLGHFIGGNYLDPVEIDCDLFYSTWKGPVIDDFMTRYKKTGKDGSLIFLPHAYCTFCDTGERVTAPDVLWIGNTYNLRDESWLKGTDIVGMKNIHPKRISDLYRSAKVCPNIHGSFQKGLVSDDNSAIAKQPGMALNERFWQILGAGGFMVCDYHPQAYEFFDQDELVMALTKEEFIDTINEFRRNQEKRDRHIRNWVKRIREAHTYEHRIRSLIDNL